MPVIDLLVLVRGIHFAATLLVTGTVCFAVLVTEPSRRLTGMVWAALALVLLSGAVWLALIAVNILETPLLAITAADAWTVITGTRFGVVSCLRLGCALALALLIAAPFFPGRRVLQLTAAAPLAGLLALVGHAGATPGTIGWLHLTADVIHILAAAPWVGGLPALAVMLSVRPLPEAAVTATARFSVLGIVSVGALLVSGALNSWELLDGPSDLMTTAYGRILSAKVLLFAAMVGVAAVNRLWLTPRLPASTAVGALRRNTLVETGLGFSVIMLVGALGTMIPGGHVHTNSAPPQSEAAFVHIHTEAVMADVTIDPGQNRKNTASVRLSREDSSEYPAREVKLVLEPREGTAQKLERAASQTPDGIWQVENLTIPRAGVWIVRLTIGTGTGAVVLDAPIVITQCSNECW